MELKKRLDSILNQKMDRQGFIKNMFLGLAAFFGFGTVLRMLEAEQDKGRNVAIGYGMNAYGGTESKKN